MPLWTDIAHIQSNVFELPSLILKLSTVKGQASSSDCGQSDIAHIQSNVFGLASFMLKLSTAKGQASSYHCGQ